MSRFVMNGYVWYVKWVPRDSTLLVDRTNTLRVATTDPKQHTIYLSDELEGPFLRTVLLHELGHVTMFSYGLIEELHRFVPEPNWIEAEEWVCNLIADYGEKIFSAAYRVLGPDAWGILPRELERLIA